MWDFFLETLLPRVCVLCEARIRGDAASTALCAGCLGRLEWIAGPTCEGCGAPVLVERPRPRRCRHCRDAPRVFSRAVCAGRYEGSLETLLRRFKYEGREHAAGPLGDRLAARLREEGLADAVDVVAAVPSDRWTYVRRTYNPAEEIAARVAAALGKPLDDLALSKRRRTAPQAELPRARRLLNLRGVYAADPRRIFGKRVLLVDDVLTTGATASECAKALWRAGARDVVLACVARSLV